MMPVAVAPEPMVGLERALHFFDRIPLQGLGTAALMDRVETKFILPRRLLPSILESLSGEYRIQDAGAGPIARYRTTYLDTPDLRFYNDHHRGRATRQKVRIRSYLDGGGSFLELKLRTNRGRSLKTRVPTGSDWRIRLDELRSVSSGHPNAVLEAALFEEVITVGYSRITLIGSGGGERVTIDVGLEFEGMTGSVRLSTLAAVEVKQGVRTRNAMTSALRGRGIRPGPMSKYCVGVAWLRPGVRINEFKPTLDRIHRIEHDEVSLASGA
jgi:hypothetical protein